MKKLLLLVLLLFPSNFHIYNSYSQEEYKEIVQPDIVEDMELAIQLSQKTGKSVVIIFSADWCKHCVSLKNDFNEIDGFNNKIVCILDSDANKKLVRQFKIKIFPTSIILNSDQEISRISGYNKESYNNWLKKH